MAVGGGAFFGGFSLKRSKSVFGLGGAGLYLSIFALPLEEVEEPDEDVPLDELEEDFELEELEELLELDELEEDLELEELELDLELDDCPHAGQTNSVAANVATSF